MSMRALNDGEVIGINEGEVGLGGGLGDAVPKPLGFVAFGLRQQVGGI